MRCVSALLALGMLAACDHAAPFGAADYGTSQPFDSASPRRITFNPGNDRAPAWLPDQSGFLYSFQPGSGSDRCLGLLPSSGGRIARETCPARLGLTDSTIVYTEPAPAPAGDGRLAYVNVFSGPTDKASRAALLLGTLADPTAATTLVSFPFVDTARVRQDEASQLRWLDAGNLLYLALRVGYDSARSRDTVRTGAEIVRLALAGTLEIIPGTTDASSVAVGNSPDTIYYTLGGDSRVFRRARSSGVVSVLFDFGAGQIARDIQVTGNRLVAVVGGTVSFGYDSLLSFNVQRDGGGPLHLVDLASGHDSVLPDTVNFVPLFFRRPALAPSGKHVVAEVLARTVADLWMLDLP